jgi:hypothetical protein
MLLIEISLLNLCRALCPVFFYSVSGVLQTSYSFFPIAAFKNYSNLSPTPISSYQRLNLSIKG